MLIESFRITGGAVAQIFILGAVGFFLVKRGILSQEGLASLSRIVIEVIFPVLIFTQLMKNFSFAVYQNWWIFPLISVAVTLFGVLTGSLFSLFVRGQEYKMQFLSLVTFQNSGYLPLAIVAAMLSGANLDTMFIYIFLFLLGFDLIVWSIGVYMLAFVKTKKFELGSLFSPPIIADIISLLIIFFGINKYIPEVVMKPLGMIGNCTLPLAMFIVGGNIACIRLEHINKKAMLLLSIAKLVLMPTIGFLLIYQFKLPVLLGLLILMQLAMPSATSLSVIIRHYKKEDLLISQGVFVSHLLSLITVPIFLSLYLTLVMVK